MILCGMAVEEDKHFVMECDSLSTYRNKYFDDLEQIVPSFSSKNVDEKFSFIMECKDNDIACVCITNICIMCRARGTLVNNISAPKEHMLIMHVVLDIDTFYVDAVHFCDRMVQSNTQVCLFKHTRVCYMKPGIVSMLKKCQL